MTLWAFALALASCSLDRAGIDGQRSVEEDAGASIDATILDARGEDAPSDGGVEIDVGPPDTGPPPCVPACETGATCVDGMCVCPTDACCPTCETGWTCEEGTCVAPCGIESAACCAEDSCDEGLRCESGVCNAICGRLGESCCADDACSEGVCDSEIPLIGPRTCWPCGASGDRCCEGEDRCEPANHACNGWTNRCERCGNRDQPCCEEGDACDESICVLGFCRGA